VLVQPEFCQQASGNDKEEDVDHVQAAHWLQLNQIGEARRHGDNQCDNKKDQGKCDQCPA
jgi:hypothetical protein